MSAPKRPFHYLSYGDVAQHVQKPISDLMGDRLPAQPLQVHVDEEKKWVTISNHTIRTKCLTKYIWHLTYKHGPRQSISCGAILHENFTAIIATIPRASFSSEQETCLWSRRGLTNFRVIKSHANCALGIFLLLEKSDFATHDAVAS